MFSQYTAQEFKDMVTRCKEVNVDIYVDAVTNHVAEGSGKLQFPWCWVDGS
jgi:pullulanase/glycogen debranching enzyme